MKIYRPIKEPGYYDCSLLELVSKAITNNDYPVLKYLFQLRKYAIPDTERYIILNNLHLISNLMDNIDLSYWLYSQFEAPKNIVIKEVIMYYLHNDNEPTFDSRQDFISIYILKKKDSNFIYYKFTYSHDFLEFSVYNSLKDNNVPSYISELNNSLIIYQNFDFPKVLTNLILNYLLSGFFEEEELTTDDTNDFIEYTTYKAYKLLDFDILHNFHLNINKLYDKYVVKD